MKRLRDPVRAAHLAFSVWFSMVSMGPALKGRVWSSRALADETLAPSLEAKSSMCAGAFPRPMGGHGHHTLCKRSSERLCEDGARCSGRFDAEHAMFRTHVLQQHLRVEALVGPHVQDERAEARIGSSQHMLHHLHLATMPEVRTAPVVHAHLCDVRELLPPTLVTGTAQVLYDVSFQRHASERKVERVEDACDVVSVRSVCRGMVSRPGGR